MNIFILLVILIFLVFIYLKLNFKKYSSQNKLMKIICRFSLSRESELMIIDILGNCYLCSSTKSEFKIVLELNATEVKRCMDEKENNLFFKKG